MQKHLKQNMLIFIIGFSILGFVIGETIGQYLEKNTPEINSHKAFGIIDTTTHPPLMSTIPPNYWHVTPTKTTTNVITDKNKVTGIVLSNACLSAIKSKSPTTCPTYKDIEYADTSNKMLSGYFGLQGGFYHRLHNNFKQNLAYYYNLNKTSVIVDPPKDIIDKIPLIVIGSSLDVFADQQDLDGTTAVNTNKTNGYLTYHQYRVVEDCGGVTDIVYTKAILLDTISFVQSHCQKTTLETLIKKPIKLTHVIDPTTTPLFKYQQYLKQTKNLGNCISKCSKLITDPNKKAGYER